jgi:hypothetical protein
MIYVFLIIAFFTLAKPAFAVCPVCTVAVGSALGISRVLGIDDFVSSIWIGGLILSSSLWASDYLEKKENFKKYSNPYLVSLIFYLFIFVPLLYTGIVGVPFNTLWGVDKIILGTMFGSAAFLLSIYLDKKVRKIKGKQLFSYQKVVFPLILLLISSFIANYLI